MITRPGVGNLRTLSAMALALALVQTGGTIANSRNQEIDETPAPVHALFDFSQPETGPYPTDYFTVPDDDQNTGRRANLPYPDCAVQVSDCQDLDVINTLDGFSLQTRIAIPFDGPIDPTSVNSQNVFVIGLGSYLLGVNTAGAVVGVNQIVWDPDTNTLHVETDALLDQASRYAVIVTDGVVDSHGARVKATKAFRHLRAHVASWYRDLLLEAIAAAEGLGVRERHIVVASVYSTQLR